MVFFQFAQKMLKLLVCHVLYIILFLEICFAAVSIIHINIISSCTRLSQYEIIVKTGKFLHSTFYSIQTLSNQYSYKRQMKVIIFCVLLALSSSILLRTHQSGDNQPNTALEAPVEIVGGFTGRKVIGQNSLSPQEKEIVAFIHKSIPQISNYDLIYTKHQVVAGMNYCFDYRSKVDKSILKMCVWSKPWENNFLRLTTTDGRVFVSGGFEPKVENSPA